MSAFDPPLPIPELAQRLIEHGLPPTDRNDIETRLFSLNYYKLEEYTWPFRKLTSKEENTRSPYFKDDANMGLIWATYLFDRRLRLLLLDAIERIETALKNQVSQVLTLSSGVNNPHAECIGLSNFKGKYEQWLRDAQKEYDKSDNPRIAHYREVRDIEDVKALPLWIVMELISFGGLRIIHAAMSDESKQQLAAAMGMGERFINSSLFLFNKVRNKCAHHGRVWNHSWSRANKSGTGSTPLFPPAALPSDPLWHCTWDEDTESCEFPGNPAHNAYFNTKHTAFVFFLAKVWLDKVAPTSHWKERVENTVAPHGTLNLAARDAGFRKNCFEHPLWRS